MGLIGFTGCSDDSEQDSRQHVAFEAQSCAVAFEEIATGDGARAASPVTRAWTPPSGYYLYNDPKVYEIVKEQVDLFYKSISVFFTQDGQTPEQGTFFYKSSSNSWRYDDEEMVSGSYYLYGFIPKEVAESATISSSSTANDNSSYSSGAVLTISGLKTVTHSDVSVIVGAKNGNSDIDHGSLATGDFSITTTNNSNYIFLLFDHLYCALRFNFKMESTYAELRTIKLTKLELTAYESINTSVKIKAKYNATITLRKTTGGASPIKSVVFSPDESSADVAYEPIYSGNEVALSATTETAFMGCFVPGQNTNFKLRTTYNVYDRQGNLIREGCEAENSLNLRNIFGITPTELERGHMYSLTLTVNPTYLYVLSEPDLDNPTVTIEH